MSGVYVIGAGVRLYVYMIYDPNKSLKQSTHLFKLSQ